ncbi:MAG: LysM peptidoglycan-binding domain-containing protein [Blastocatellia bacterium]|nr:LysM peptidoglycan-binding domain-containing protein [Blastocatellia bacterium]
MVNVNRIGGLTNLQRTEDVNDQYLTQPGDTMTGVAESFGVNRQALIAANPFIANPEAALPPGVFLRLPKQEEVKPNQREREGQSRQQQQSQKEEQEGKPKPPVANLETVTNNPVINSKRNYELARGELSLAALNLSSFASVQIPNPETTGRYTREHLLADTAFTNMRSMDSMQIQKLLHERGSALSKLLLPDSRSVAQFLEALAINYKINPQILIVLLQRERGLISSKQSKTPNQESLDWVFGIGKGRGEHFKGFDRQLDALSRRLSLGFQSAQEKVPAVIVLDGIRRSVENAATMVIYQLAPKESLGKLFFDIWQSLFGSDGLGRPV